MITVKWLESRLNKPRDKEKVVAYKHGLYVRIRKTGHISFVFRYSWEGKRDKITIGAFPKIKLSEATGVAEKYNHQIAHNINPKRERKLNRIKIANEHSVKSLALKWWNFHYDDHPNKNLTRGTPHNVKRSFEIHIFQKFGDLPWEGIDRAEWTELFAQIKKRSPSIASRLVTSVKQIAIYAIQNGISTHHPLMEYSAKNSLGVIKRKGNRVLSDDEISKIGDTIKYSRMKESNKILFELLFIYGCRTQELRLCEPKHLDFDKRIWTVPRELNKPKDKKNISLARPIVRPLFDETIELFKRAMQINPKSSWVFPKERRTNIDEPVSDTAMLDIPNRIRMNIIDKYPDCRMESWTKHDIRRTVRTRMANIVSRDVAESMLGHVLGGTEDSYNLNNFVDEKLVGYKAWYEQFKILWNV